jgi:hypothetical protein
MCKVSMVSRVLSEKGSSPGREGTAGFSSLTQPANFVGLGQIAVGLRQNLQVLGDVVEGVGVAELSWRRSSWARLKPKISTWQIRVLRS